MRRQPLSTPFTAPDGIPGVVRAGGFRPIGVDGAYSAFPSICQFVDRSLRLVWRQGVAHTGLDGLIKTSTSTDNGRTWSASSTVLGTGATTDYRDPVITTFLGVTHLTYFKAISGLTAAGAFYRQSTDNGATWGTERRIDPSQPYAAISGPVVRLPNGDLITSYYGKNAGNTFDSSWSAKSTDNGVSWTRTLMADGQTAGRDYQEPWIISTGGTTLYCFYRYANSLGVGLSISTDSGATWSSPVQLFGNATGRPSAAWLPTNTMVIAPRYLDNKQAFLRARKGGSGSTAWSAPMPVGLPVASGPLGMVYAHPLPILGGTICALGVELSTSSSRIEIGWINEGPGVSPLGDLFQDEINSVLSQVDNIFATTFRQINGAPERPWVVMAGSVAVTDGELASTSADNVVDLAAVHMGTREVDIEADLLTTGPDAGMAIIFRMTAANTYLMFTVETTGTTWRLYKVVAGTATQLFSVSGAMNFGAYHTYRVIAKGNGIWCYVNNLIISPNSANFGQGFYSHQLSGGDMTTFDAGYYHGVKLNSQGTTTNKCRRFSVKGN